jgi:hypothetical protein
MKANHKSVCLDLLNHFEHEPAFFKGMLTSDESWNFEYDAKMKCQSEEWLTKILLHPKKPRKNKSQIKLMFACLFIMGEWYTRCLCLSVNLVTGPSVNKSLNSYEKVFSAFEQTLLTLCFYLVTFCPISQCIVFEGNFDIQEYCNRFAAPVLPRNVPV